MRLFSVVGLLGLDVTDVSGLRHGGFLSLTHMKSRKVLAVGDIIWHTSCS